MASGRFRDAGLPPRMTALLLIILGGLCAVAYGIVTINDVMRRDAGTP
jgi:K(+)-stimulated pyrophosphate-energized sodium pump